MTNIPITSDHDPGRESQHESGALQAEALDQNLQVIAGASEIITDTDYINHWNKKVEERFGPHVARLKVIADGGFIYGDGLFKPPSNLEVSAINILLHHRERLISRRRLGTLCISAAQKADAAAVNVVNYFGAVGRQAGKDLIRLGRRGVGIRHDLIVEDADTRLRLIAAQSR
jgi:hypothetical protein